MSETPTSAPRRKLSAILFADVAGFSRLMAANEDETFTRVTRAIGLFRSLVLDYGGRVVDVAGDGIFAVFESVMDALRFAQEIQREFRNASVWVAGEEAIRFRIALHVGEVIVDGERVQGHHVNIAARIQLLADPGGICMTDAFRRTLPRGWPIRTRSLGRPELKNLGGVAEILALDMEEQSLEVSVRLPDAPPVPPVLPADAASSRDVAVAVLPMGNLSRDPADDHLCDGFTADVITSLSRFREIAVIARHSAFLFKSSTTPIDQIAHKLGAHYVLTGGLQHGGERLRVRVRLLDAADGRIVWAENYDGRMTDIFDFQDDVCGVIAFRLASQVAAAERRRLGRQHVPDLAAYGLILRGADLSMRHRREAVLHARRLFEEAAVIDPRYARSYAGMSRTCNLTWRYRWASDAETYLDKAVTFAERAIEHDGLDARGFGELGFSYLYRKQHDASIAAYRRAVELNPNDADILADYGDALVYAGSPEEAVAQLERAIKLNPFHPDFYHWALADARFTLGDYRGTISTLLRMRDQSEASRMLAASHALLGERVEAERHAQQILSTRPDFSIEHWRTVPPYRDLEPLERFVEGLRQAGLP